MACSVFNFETAISVSCLAAGCFALLMMLSQPIHPCLLLLSPAPSQRWYEIHFPEILIYAEWGEKKLLHICTSKEGHVCYREN